MKTTEGAINSPKGFKAAGMHCGVKKQKKDLAVIYSETPAMVSAVFTRNLVKAPPLLWCKKIISKKSKINAIVINSGNANACTGEKGYEDAALMALTFGNMLQIPPERVLVTSTGVIGQFLPIDRIVSGINTISKQLSPTKRSADDCAEAIMTTDTFPKAVCVEFDINGVPVKIAGIAKGSGMIHPNMATMLAFITTDINITKDLLDTTFKESIENSFNMITVDGDTSTNDMAVMMANGEAKNPLVKENTVSYMKFKGALDYITVTLAKMIIKDAEGATKFLEVEVINSKSEADAKTLIKSVLTSSLVKTAFFGQDANWGRILSAMGNSGIQFNPELVTISFVSGAGQITLFEKGLPLLFNEKKALEILKEKEIKIEINLGEGKEKALGWGCDLSYDYVKINASYRT